LKELIHGGFFSKVSSWIRDGLLVSKKAGDEPPSYLIADIPKECYGRHTPFEIPSTAYATSIVINIPTVAFGEFTPIEMPTGFFGRGNTV